MGGWKLEVYKMFIYVTFPVATFYYFHQPQIYEKWLIKMRHDTFPPEDPRAHEMLKEVSRKMQKAREDKRLQEMEESMRKF